MHGTNMKNAVVYRVPTLSGMRRSERVSELRHKHVIRCGYMGREMYNMATSFAWFCNLGRVKTTGHPSPLTLAWKKSSTRCDRMKKLWVA